MPSSSSRLVSLIALASHLGFAIAIPITLGVILGSKLDRAINTSPVFLLLGIISSLIFTIFELKRVLTPLLK